MDAAISGFPLNIDNHGPLPPKPSTPVGCLVERRVRVVVRPPNEEPGSYGLGCVSGGGGNIIIDAVRERGTHCASFAENTSSLKSESSGGWRYIFVSKSGEFASRDSEDFHWVADFEPWDASSPTTVVAEIENGLWTFSSGEACVTYGVTRVGEEPPRLPCGAPEYDCIKFTLRPSKLGESDGVVFVPEWMELPREVQPAYRLYYETFADFNGHELSDEAVKSVGCPQTNLTYGESHFMPIYRLLRQLGVSSGDVVVDLGSGTGRIVLSAALAKPCLGSCRGVELLPGLHVAALRALERVTASDVPCAPVIFSQADVLDQDWSDASVVFAMSLCFPADVLEAIVRKALELREGSWFVTQQCYIGSDGECASDVFGISVGGRCLRPARINDTATSHKVRVEMSYAYTPWYVFERVNASLIQLDTLD
eukprot:TRINITY_DN61061_c0_g1_i1.p1 TRINITY_DN61061_c0_g1~~TRINITY_DN61061_c0_g1_i1.p1  ORF type:complete len:425 (-),score=70.37 TRINITY_DN61061_c0_g1_i1:61-1335(-)